MPKSSDAVATGRRLAQGSEVRSAWIGLISLPKMTQAGPIWLPNRNAFQPYVSQLPRGRDGAAYRTRTCDPIITNDVLYQLS